MPPPDDTTDPVGPIDPPAGPTPSPASTTVSFTAEDALNIAKTLGAAAIAINPITAGAVTAITGIAELITSVILPAIQHLKAHEITIVEQAALAAQSAAERARVGAPSAPVN